MLHPDAKVGFDNTPYLKLFYWPTKNGGGKIEIHTRVQLWDGVAVVALDEITHHIYMVQISRDTEEGPRTGLEIPGGGVEPDYPVAHSAVKELFEETGTMPVNDGDLIQLSPPKGYSPKSGHIMTHDHYFLVLRATKVGEHDGEVEKVQTFPLSELIAMDNRNEFRDPFTPYCLRRAQDYLRENRPDLLT